MKNHFFLFAASLLLLNFWACDNGGNGNGNGTDTTAVDTTPQPDVLSWEENGIKVYALDPASPEYENASLTVDMEAGADFEAGSQTFNFNVEGYTLGEQTSDAAGKGLANSGMGQHIHVILNDQPYMAHYEPQVDVELEEGLYLMTAFLSRSYHESVKSPRAGLLTQFTVGGVEDEPYDLNAPALIYSRPKGTYKGKGETDKILLDFYLFNTTLARDGNQVKVSINGTEFLLPEWRPYIVEGLPMGENEFEISLVDAEGNMVEGSITNTSRLVVLEEEDKE